ncbi:MAG: hypothetical protein NT135_01760 [Candidatus Berkelbacteria bacterium]|nr:hypothetical protein [Candidatus Berkelbacteria bacterium]
MKKALFILLALLIIPSIVFAASSSTKLPTRFDYWWESINYNLFTWKSTSKVTLLDQYANRRVEVIKIAVKDNNLDLTKKFIADYQNFKTKQFDLIKNKNLNQTMTQIAAENTISQQKELSILRQGANQDIKKEIASIQETVANNQQKLLEQKENKQAAEQFAEQIVAVWHDPQNITKNEEKATRIYAAGTTPGGRDGVVIDGGEGKIVQKSNGELKIEYASGTGPNSVINTQGKAVWTIQQSDGTVVTSYQAAGQVVVGGTKGTAGNVIVGSGGQATSGSGQQVVGGTSGTSGQKVEGNVIQGQGGSGDVKVQTQP